MESESVLRLGLFFAGALAEHMTIAMYWVWLPGFVLSAWVALRYAALADEGVRRSGDGGPRPILWGALVGLTLSPNRREGLEASLNLLREGRHPATALAAYLASRTLAPYLLAIWTLLLGIEFAVGQVVGAAAMILLVSAGLRYAAPEAEWARARGRLRTCRSSKEAAHGEGGETSWRALLLSGRGWRRTLRHVGREGRRSVPPLAAGVLAGGFILAAGVQPWWVDLAYVGGGGLRTDLLNAFVAPALSLVSAIGPVGSLPVASNLFSAYGLAYPGVVAFVLAGALKPQDLSSLGRALGWRLALRLGALLYLSAGVAGLVATGAFALFGFRPGHVPLFR
ncbi:MAG: permease, partial [Nitrospinota bacterium]